MSREEMLDLLETLLALTEYDARRADYWRAWQRVSARVADERAASDAAEAFWQENS